MSAMLARVSEPGSYQALQHFITDAPWARDRVWQQMRRLVPAREGVLIFDGTSFPKQGPHSVGVARQYCGALGKIANCQVATTVALWTGTQAWLLGAHLYLPKDWLTPDGRRRGRIPATVRFQEKWRHALTLLRQVRAAGFQITAVLDDAELGHNSTLRTTLHRARLRSVCGGNNQYPILLNDSTATQAIDYIAATHTINVPVNQLPVGAIPLAAHRWRNSGLRQALV